MIQCQGCTCAGWLWEGEGGLGDHQPGVYVPLKALFFSSFMFYYKFSPSSKKQTDQSCFEFAYVFLISTSFEVLYQSNIFIGFYRTCLYRSSNFRPSVRSFVRPCVRSSVRPSTFTSKFSFLDIRDSCESETLHSNCP